MLLDPQINANALTWAQDSNKARTETIDDGRGSNLVRGVDPRGLEPLTPCLQSRCATNCAMGPGEGRLYAIVQGRATRAAPTLSGRLQAIGGGGPGCRL